MAQAIQGRHRRPDRHGLPDAHFPNDHPEAGLGDDEADAGHRLVVRRPAVEVLGGDGLGEGRAGEAEVAHPGRAVHGWSPPVSLSSLSPK